ncbi:polysulfide reductase NrfD [Candidatus Sumerlaeota bacterium]|nr:polysulfide reductase NrfD [Candidatus Sumerlaeota bacterium]
MSPPRFARLRFLWHALMTATEGPLPYLLWMLVLTLVALVGLHAWARQASQGLILTHMTNQVLWGLYIANFTFLVGIAAGAVMMIIPAHLCGDREMRRVAIIGELMAIAAIAMCLLFVVVDLGRPDRLWHLIPFLGRLNWPQSILAWDVIVLGVYLLLNAALVWHQLFSHSLGRRPWAAWHRPAIWISIGWAIAIHTVTAFILCGLVSRPFWNTALMAPRFLASAFVSGPALLIITLLLLRRWTRAPVGEAPTQTLLSILRVTVILNLLFIGCEIFTVFHTGGSHSEGARFLYFGLESDSSLVPWIWFALALDTVAALMLLHPRSRRLTGWLAGACLLATVGIWIEKGLGLIVPGFIPSPLHEVVHYTPSALEWQITAGVWALGLLIFSAGLRVAIPTLCRDVGAGEKTP